MNSISLFDLHCDTLTECCKNSLSLRKNGLQISIEKASCYDNWFQVFAIWLPDEIRGDDAWQYFLRNADYFDAQLAENTDRLLRCTSGGDIVNACKTGKYGAILSIEGGGVLGGQPDRLFKAYERGVRLMTLTWNGDNEIGSGSVTGGNGGLTGFGRQVISDMNRLGMVIDVSHLNERGFFDVAELTTKPFIASHSNYADICKHKRNLTREQLDCIIKCHGLAGLNIYSAFLGNGENGCLDECYAHISYALENGAEDILALGCDYDGADIAPQLDSVEKLETLYEYFLSKRISESVIRKIFFENAYNFLKDNI